jgi:hypothetical protein
MSSGEGQRSKEVFGEQQSAKVRKKEKIFVKWPRRKLGEIGVEGLLRTRKTTWNVPGASEVFVPLPNATPPHGYDFKSSCVVLRMIQEEETVQVSARDRERGGKKNVARPTDTYSDTARLRGQQRGDWGNKGRKKNRKGAPRRGINVVKVGGDGPQRRQSAQAQQQQLHRLLPSSKGPYVVLRITKGPLFPLSFSPFYGPSQPPPPPRNLPFSPFRRSFLFVRSFTVVLLSFLPSFSFG